MDVPIFRLKYDQEFRDKFYNYCDQIFDKAFLTNDDFVLQFEQAFAKWSQSPHAITVTNGTAALEALLRAIDVKDKEVIIPTNTFMATAVAVKSAGGKPVIADIEKQYGSLCPQRTQELINDNTKAIITVHIGGLISPSILELQKICREKNLSLIEDCAHAHGSSLQKTPAGLFGAGGSFSFFTTKVLTTGEGGMSITKHKEIYDAMISIRQFGKEAHNPISHFRDGNNLKMTEFQAALGLLELERANERIQQRQRIAEHYQNTLASTDWNPLSAAPDSECSYYKQILWPQKDKEKLHAFLKQHSIQLTGGVYNIPLHRQPLFKNDYSDSHFPVANDFADHHICPPCYADMTLEEADFVCQKLLEYQEN